MGRSLSIGQTAQQQVLLINSTWHHISFQVQGRLDNSGVGLCGISLNWSIFSFGEAYQHWRTEKHTNTGERRSIPTLENGSQMMI
jgi:ferric-dicitrate binding protein FerR (iron transport regulator)